MICVGPEVAQRYLGLGSGMWAFGLQEAYSAVWGAFKRFTIHMHPHRFWGVLDASDQYL